MGNVIKNNTLLFSYQLVPCTLCCTLQIFKAFWHILWIDIPEEPDLHKYNRDEKTDYHIDPYSPDSFSDDSQGT